MPNDVLPSLSYRATPRLSEAGSQTTVRLAYDARFIRPQASGIGQVCLELLRGLIEFGHRLNLTVLVNPTTPIPIELKWNERVRYIEVPWRPHGIRNQLHLSALLRSLGIQIFHSVDSYSPLWPFGGHRVVHIHDLIPLCLAEGCHQSKKSQYRGLWRSWLRLQARQASRIICGSCHAAEDLFRVLHVSPEKIHVIPNPIRQWNQLVDEQLFRKQHRLTGRIISYVGRQDPYKNTLMLIRSLPLLNQRLPQERIQLVLAGMIDERYPETRQEVQKLNLQDQVCFPGYLDEASLGTLYKISDLFLFPSLYEGFGMPPLEAMRFGTPVIAGRQSCLPEVLGNAAYYIDKQDPNSLVDAIVQIFTDHPLTQQLQQAGFERVAHYSRDEIVPQFLHLYEDLLHGPPTSPSRVSFARVVVEK